MHIKKELGNIGEQIAVEYLEKNNYQILKRNFYCKQGEIDIIANDEQEIVFIEVKTRSGIDFGQPSEAVNRIKQKHMYRTAQYFLYKSNDSVINCGSNNSNLFKTFSGVFFKV